MTWFKRRTPRQKLIDEIVKLIDTNEKQAISNREAGERLLSEAKLDAARAGRLRKDLVDLRKLEAIDNPPRQVNVPEDTREWPVGKIVRTA